MRILHEQACSTNAADPKGWDICCHRDRAQWPITSMDS